MPMRVKVGRVMSYEELPPVKSHDSLIGLDKLCNPAKIVGNVLNITIVHLPRLLDVSKTCFKISCKYAFKVSSKCLRLEDVLEDKKCYAEDVFSMSSTRLHQDEC